VGGDSNSHNGEVVKNMTCEPRARASSQANRPIWAAPATTAMSTRLTCSVRGRRGRGMGIVL